MTFEKLAESGFRLAPFRHPRKALVRTADRSQQGERLVEHLATSRRPVQSQRGDQLHQLPNRQARHRLSHLEAETAQQVPDGRRPAAEVGGGKRFPAGEESRVPRPRLPSNRRSCRQPPADTSEPYRTRTFRGTGPGRAGHTPPRPEESRGGTAPAVPHGNGKHLRLAKLPDATGCRSEIEFIEDLGVLAESAACSCSAGGDNPF